MQNHTAAGAIGKISARNSDPNNLRAEGCWLGSIHRFRSSQDKLAAQRNHPSGMLDLFLFTPDIDIIGLFSDCYVRSGIQNNRRVILYAANSCKNNIRHSLARQSFVSE